MSGGQVREPCVASIRIRGLAERADSPEQPLGPDVIVPESVPLRLEYGAGETVGTARLRRDEAGIWAEAEIPPDTGRDRVPAWHHSHHPADLWPKFAVGIARALSEGGTITSGEIACVCLVRENTDTTLPPWEIITDPPGECGRCGTTLQYRDRYLRRDSRWTQEKVPDPWCPHCEDDWEHLDQLFYSDMKFCGCGDPESVYELTRDLLELLRERWEEGAEPQPQGPASEELAAHEGVKITFDWRGWKQRFRDRIGGGDGTYYAVLYWLDGSGLIEHGGSVSGSWLTLKGKHYLSLMQAHEWDDVDEVGLPHDGNDCGPGCRHWEASTEDYEKDRLKRDAKASSARCDA